MKASWVLALACSACLVENNPAFYDETPTSGPVGSSSSTGSTSPDTGSSSDTGSSEGSSSSTGNDPCPTPEACEETHVGPSAMACPHQVGQSDTDLCDFHGRYALRVAAAAARLVGGGIIVVHDDDGDVAEYVGGIDIFANTRIGAAPQTPAENLVISCEEDAVANLRLLGNDTRISGVTLVTGDGCHSGISVRTDPLVPGTETRGHLIEGIIVAAYSPEFMGSNAIAQPIVSLGPDTVLRNSYFRGYQQGGIDLRFATLSRVVGNTFVHFQAYGASVFDVQGATRLLIANNVFVALTRSSPRVAAGSTATTDLTFVGNFAEGFDAMVTGVDPVDHTIADNTLGQIELESPAAPRFLADSSQRASPLVLMNGASADGVDLSTLGDPFPGALQVASRATLPRATTVRVGEGTCGVDLCDVTAADDDEIQQAVWRAWPGSTVEIYPSATPYAGSAVISWPVALVGTGTAADEVMLVSGEEDPFLRNSGLWDQHAAVVAVTRNMATPVTIEGLMISAPADTAAVLIESSDAGQEPQSEHVLRRLWIEDDGSGPMPRGMYLGDTTVIQDVLIRGDTQTCIRYGVRLTDEDPTPMTTSYVTNLTCRLQTAETNVAAFDVASVEGSVFVNLVIDMEAPGPLLHAQRRSIGDIDPTALDAPTSFTVDAASVRDSTADFANFSRGDGTYAVTIDMLSAAPLFVSPIDSHLAPSAAPVDAGVDPSLFTPELAAGVDLDGVDRTAHVIDRGAYEQGL